MKTCYGGYCYEHIDSSEFSSVLSSPIKPFLMGVAIVLTLALVTSFFTEASVTNYLTNGFINDFPNSDYLYPK